MIFITEYTVLKGDTLYGISNQFGVSAIDLANLNNVKENTIYVGQILKIPEKQGTNPSTLFMYTVKKGDSLYSISVKYYTSVDEIKKINNLSNNTLYIGQVLRIPEIYTKEDEMYAPNYTSYTVQNGDTLYSISKKFNVSIDNLLKDNGLVGLSIKPNQILKIRIDSSTMDENLECFGRESEIEDNYVYYTVKKGDNLYSIAKNFNTSVNQIQKLNNMTNTNLTIGSVIKVLDNNKNVYIVQKGDNLYSISRKYNVSVDDIKKKNNLKSNVLSIGQKLYL